MSNLDTATEDDVVSDRPRDAGVVEVLTPRDVPLGGPRAMTVRRTLPTEGSLAHRRVVLPRPLRPGRRQ
jgi:hypothetical protein